MFNEAERALDRLKKMTEGPWWAVFKSVLDIMMPPWMGAMFWHRYNMEIGFLVCIGLFLLEDARKV